MLKSGVGLSAFHSNKSTQGLSPIPRSTPTLTRLTGPTTYPPQVNLDRPFNWFEDQNIKVVMQWSTDITFATGVTTSSPVTMLAGTTSYNFGLSAIVSGTYYIRACGFSGSSLPKAPNWSNTIGVGVATAPTISTSTAMSGYAYLGGSVTLTASREIANWAFAYGSDATFTVTPLTSTTATLTWSSSTTNGALANVIATDYFGNASAVWNGVLTVSANEPTLSGQFTAVRNAALSAAETSNTITLSGGQPGTVWPYVLTGSPGTGSVYKNGLLVSSSGTAIATDQLYVTDTASASYSTTITDTLTVGATASTYSVTTLPNIPASGLVVRLDAYDSPMYQLINGTTPVASSGDSLGYWGDLSGNGNHFTGGANDTTRPTWNTSGGKNWVAANGTSQYLQRLSDLGLYSAGASSVFVALKTATTTPAYLFGIGKQASATPRYSTMCSDSSSNGRLSSLIRNDASTIVVPNSTNLYGVGYSSTAKVIGVIDDGSHLTGYENGVAGTPFPYSRSGSTLNALDLAVLFAQPSATKAGWMNCSIAAIIVYNRVLNSTEIAQVNAYLATLI